MCEHKQWPIHQKGFIAGMHLASMKHNLQVLLLAGELTFRNNNKVTKDLLCLIFINLAENQVDFVASINLYLLHDLKLTFPFKK